MANTEPAPDSQLALRGTAGEAQLVGRRGLAHVNTSTNKKVPGTRCQLITYFHASNFKLPDS